MDILSGILGKVLLFFAVIVGIVVLAVIRFLIKYRGALRALLSGGAPTPSTITLVRCADEPAWMRKPAARRDLQTLRGAGFQDVGAFQVPEMPGVELIGLVNGHERMYAVTYRHPAAGIWSDVVVLYEDGRGRTASSAPTGGQVDQPPWTDNIHEPRAAAGRLLERTRATALREGRKVASAERFASDFTEAYAREMAWRNGRGGVTEDEIRRVAAASGTPLKEGDVEKAHSVMQAETKERLRVECLHTLLAGGTVADDDVRRIVEVGAVVITEQMNAAEVWDHLREAVDVPDAVVPALERLAASSEPARDVFARMAALMPAEVRPQHVGRVTEPVGADVWVLQATEVAAR